MAGIKRVSLALMALVTGGSAAWAHPGHVVGDALVGDTLHAALGTHWAVAEPVLMLAAVVAASRVAGWLAVRLVARVRTRA
jgi:hypothetical protein